MGHLQARKNYRVFDQADGQQNNDLDAYRGISGHHRCERFATYALLTL
jgi:hypothetical protein